MKENNIKNAMEKIEPSPGAKQRMYRGIEEKAANAGEKKEKIVSVKFIRAAASIAACVCIAALAAVYFTSNNASVNEEPSDMAGENPFEIVNSAEDFGKINISLEAPESAENIQYVIIDGEIAEIDFEINGKEYYVRASKLSDDFSGISGSVISQTPLNNEKQADLITISGATQPYKVVKWSDGGTNYFLCNSDRASDEEMSEIFEMFS